MYQAKRILIYFFSLERLAWYFLVKNSLPQGFRFFEWIFLKGGNIIIIINQNAENCQPFCQKQIF